MSAFVTRGEQTGGQGRLAIIGASQALLSVRVENQQIDASGPSVHASAYPFEVRFLPSIDQGEARFSARRQMATMVEDFAAIEHTFRLFDPGTGLGRAKPVSSRGVAFKGDMHGRAVGAEDGVVPGAAAGLGLSVPA